MRGGGQEIPCGAEFGRNGGAHALDSGALCTPGTTLCLPHVSFPRDGQKKPKMQELHGRLEEARGELGLTRSRVLSIERELTVTKRCCCLQGRSEKTWDQGIRGREGTAAGSGGMCVIARRCPVLPKKP